MKRVAARWQMTSAMRLRPASQACLLRSTSLTAPGSTLRCSFPASIFSSSARRYSRRGAKEDHMKGVPSLDDLEQRWEREIQRTGGLPPTEEQQQTEAAQNQPGMRFEIDSASLTYDDSGTANGLFTSEHTTYVGQVDRSGSPHGMGRFTDDEQRIEYLGEWRAGHWHGWGKLVQANGDVLEGQWDRGVFSGEGRLSQTEGGIYDGQWKYNRPCGEGRYVLPDGTVYSGLWGRERDFADPFESEQPTSSTAGSPRSAIAGADGSEEMGAPEAEIGIGTIRYPNRAFYDGEWCNLRPHGTGKLSLDDGSEYKGEFEDGLFHGKGRLRYANRGEYEGEWRNGRKQGQGRMLHPDGKVEIGHWKRDRLVEPAQDKEDYVDATQSWLMPDRHKPASVRGVPAAEVIGPSEPRGKWAGRYSGTGTKPFGDNYADDDDLDEDEREEEEELGGGPSEFVRRNDGLTQGYRKSSSHSRWEPLKGRGRT